MSEIKTLVDEYGIIKEACKILPSDEFKLKFLDAMAEMEDNNSHKHRQFPKTRLHKIKVVKKNIYRGDIDKMSGWRFHAQYIGNEIHIKDIIDGKNHEDILKFVYMKNDRYA